MPPSDVPSAVHESMTRVASLAKRLVDGIMQRYTERVQTALQTLAQAGPLCPAVELVVKVEAHTQTHTHTDTDRHTHTQAHRHRWTHCQLALLPVHACMSVCVRVCVCLCVRAQELCRSWHQLRQSGTPPKAADGLRAAALSALSLYGTCLHTHMGAVPNMVST